MIQAAGAFLVLLGAIAWHIASSSSGKTFTKVTDIWGEFLQVMTGSK